MSTPTPTPRTDEQINGKPCTRFAVCAGDSLRDAFVPSEFARTLERELSDMQAHYKDAQADALRFKLISEHQEARAEAAEAALIEVQSTLRYFAEWHGSCTDCHPDDADPVKDAPAIALNNRVTKALALTPAETRSVIAGLRAQDEFHFGILKECHAILCTNQESHTLLPDKIRLLQQCHISEKQAKTERGEEIAGLREEVAAITSEYEEAKRLYMENDERAVQISNHACNLEAQLAALISAGNALREMVMPSSYNEPLFAAWQAAVSGAHAGANIDAEVAAIRRDLDTRIKRDCGLTVMVPTKELAELREDKERMDFIESNGIGPSRNSHNKFTQVLNMQSFAMRVFSESTARSAIDAARKAQP